VVTDRPAQVRVHRTQHHDLPFPAELLVEEPDGTGVDLELVELCELAGVGPGSVLARWWIIDGFG